MTTKDIVKKTPRESNMELMRIVSMLLVLVVHADFLSLRAPSHADVMQHPVGSFMRIWTDALALVCVNCFVLISGYFGIRLRKKGVFAFLFQVLFYAVGIYLFFAGMGKTVFSWGTLASTLIPTSSLWFVDAYLGLMLLTPLLNRFVETTEARSLGFYILGFYGVLFSLEWCLGSMQLFKNGYTTGAFIGLYLAGRYIRLHGTQRIFNLKPQAYLGIYGVLTLISAAAFLLILFHPAGSKIAILAERKFASYAAPQTVLGSIALLLFFSKIKIQKKWINYVASSAFSVYLIHCNKWVLPYFKEAALGLYQNNPTFLYMGKITLFLIGVFLGCVLIDQLRKGCYLLLQKVFSR